MDAIEVLAGGLIGYAGILGTSGALMALRALASIAPPPYGERARRAADRLAANGVHERSWAPFVGSSQATAAWLSFDPVDDDGVSVMVGFDGAGGPSTVGVYIDQNLGGIAKDAFVLPEALDRVLAQLTDNPAGIDGVSYREIALEEAAARWRGALAMTDMFADPPSSEDLDDLRAIVMARLATLPQCGDLPAPAEVGEDERDRLVSEFLDSDETLGFFGIGDEQDENEAVEGLAHQILTFAVDYVTGTPFRFSPVMVEMFCLDWAPRKIAMDGDAFTLLPDVLAAWIRFWGRRRDLPIPSIREAVDAAYEYAPEMIELSQDPDVWGPAKTVVLAMQQRGIEPTDRKATADFIAEVNRDGGIDVLARSLAGSVKPKR